MDWVSSFIADKGERVVKILDYPLLSLQMARVIKIFANSLGIIPDSFLWLLSLFDGIVVLLAYWKGGRNAT